MKYESLEEFMHAVKKELQNFGIEESLIEDMVKAYKSDIEDCYLDGGTPLMVAMPMVQNY